MWVACFFPAEMAMAPSVCCGTSAVRSNELILARMVSAHLLRAERNGNVVRSNRLRGWACVDGAIGGQHMHALEGSDPDGLKAAGYAPPLAPEQAPEPGTVGGHSPLPPEPRPYGGAPPRAGREAKKVGMEGDGDDAITDRLLYRCPLLRICRGRHCARRGLM